VSIEVLLIWLVMLSWNVTNVKKSKRIEHFVTFVALSKGETLLLITKDILIVENLFLTLTGFLNVQSVQKQNA